MKSCFVTMPALYYFYSTIHPENLQKQRDAKSNRPTCLHQKLYPSKGEEAKYEHKDFNASMVLVGAPHCSNNRYRFKIMIIKFKSKSMKKERVIKLLTADSPF